MKSKLSQCVLSVALGGIAAAGLHAQNGFEPGDLYLYTPVYYGISTGNGAIVKIDPHTGATTVLVDVLATNNGQDSMAYDRYRDRLIMRGGVTDLTTAETLLIDSAGNATSLGFASIPGPTLGGFAPRGDGIIYFRGYFSQTEIRYYDADDSVQKLMDATGVVPFVVPGFTGSIRHMLFHPASNSLLVTAAGGVGNNCSGGNPLSINIRRLDLSADGSRVLNVECFQYDLDPGNFSGVPVGLSPGPGDDVIMTIDNNSNSALPRMARIDVANATATPYATNSNNFSAATNAGCYSHTLGKAIILDTFEDALRAFGPGEVSAGTIIASGVSHAGSSGEVATLVEIGAGTTHHTMTADTGTVSAASGGTQNWAMDFSSDHAGDIYLVLGSVTGWVPGVNIGSVNVPLMADAYTTFTINRANSPLFPMSLGTLDGLGRASSAIALNPGIPADLIGLTLYHATISFSPIGDVDASTNAVTLTIE